MEGIVDTVPKVHPILPLIKLLKFDGTLLMLGAPPEPYEFPISTLLMGKYIYIYIYIFIYYKPLLLSNPLRKICE